MELIQRYKTHAYLVAAGLLLTACGQTSPPTPDNVRQDLEFFTIEDVTDGSGEPLRCVMYGSDSSVTSDSKSWFSFDCDFEGSAAFPGEPEPINSDYEDA